MIKLKICCINSFEEAITAIEFGASAIGLVGEMPSGPGVITDSLIKIIAAAVPPPIAAFLLTSETRGEEIVKHHHRTYTNTIQLVDAPELGTYAYLRENIPAVKLVQVVHVLDEKSVEYSIKVSNEVDALLLDSGNPNLAIKELGGTGRTHNWKLSRKIAEQSSKPVFLAGGLNPDNVREAVETVHPFGIDVCSGVRTNGSLDKYKLEKFVRELFG